MAASSGVKRRITKNKARFLIFKGGALERRNMSAAAGT